jgi:hypothetical protein
MRIKSIRGMISMCRKSINVGDLESAKEETLEMSKAIREMMRGMA